MKRSEHFNVVAGKWLNGYTLSVNGRKYAISGVSPDNKLVLHCLDANDIVCEYSDFLRDKSCFFCGDIVSKYDGGVPIYYFVDAFTDVSGIFTVVFSYLDSDGKIAHCYSDKVMYRVREEVTFEYWLSRGFMYNAESNTLCPISYELTDNSYVFYCSDEPVSVLANWKIGTYGFAKNKFPFIVPFQKFNPDNIGKSLHYNVIKQQ